MNYEYMKNSRHDELRYITLIDITKWEICSLEVIYQKKKKKKAVRLTTELKKDTSYEKSKKATVRNL